MPNIESRCNQLNLGQPPGLSRSFDKRQINFQPKSYCLGTRNLLQSGDPALIRVERRLSFGLPTEGVGSEV